MNFIPMSGCHELPFVTIPLRTYITYVIGKIIMKYYAG